MTSQLGLRHLSKAVSEHGIVHDAVPTLNGDIARAASSSGTFSKAGLSGSEQSADACSSGLLKNRGLVWLLAMMVSASSLVELSIEPVLVKLP